MSDPSAPQPHREGAGSARPDPEGERLQQELEQRLARGADPLDALADLLSGRSTDEHVLLGMQGETLGGYRLVAVIGRGGMGVTWLGRDAAGNEAAVKVVTGLHGTAGERFDNECRILKSLQHEAIVRYLGHGVLGDGRGFLVMEHVRGVDLEVLLDDALEPDPRTDAAALLLDGFEARGPLVLHQGAYQRRMLRLLAGVADALHHAHQQGIVHRDLKPANVLVSTALEPTLIDFGLSRDAMQKVSLSRSGQALGTLAYMAPEQFGRDPGNVSPRTDIYALGLMLYRAMTGTDLRADMHDLMQRAKQPFLLDARTSRSMPVDVQAILYRCLDARPERRYRDAHQLALDLRAAAAHGTVSVRRPSWLALHLRSPLGKVTRLVAVVAAAAALVGLAWPAPRHELKVHALDPTIAVRLDGRPIESPHRGSIALDGAGRHELEVLIGPRVVDRVAFEVPPGAQTTVLPLLHTHVRSEPLGRVQVSGIYVHARDQLGMPPSWIQFLTGEVFSSITEQRTLDGAPVPTIQGRRPFWIQDNAGGARTLAVSHGDLQESITFTTLPNHVHDVVLLPKQLLSVPGRHRRTLATVHSPLPEGLALRLQGAVAHLERNTQETSKIASFLPMAMACITPLQATREPALAVVDITFPELVRSICVMFRSGADRDGELQLSYRIDEHDEVAVGSGQMLASPVQLPVPEVLEVAPAGSGCRRFRLIARMRSAHDHADGVAVRHLGSMVCGGHVESDPVCLAVVADPDPVSWFAGPALAAGTHRRSLLEASRAEFAPAIALEHRPLATLPPGRIPGAMVLEPGRGGPDRLDIVATSVRMMGALPAGSGQIHRVDVRTGQQQDPVPCPDLQRPPLSMLSVADVDGDRQRDLVIGDHEYSEPGYHSGRVFLVSSATGITRHTWQLPPQGNGTPHHSFGEVLQPLQSHATDTLFLAGAGRYPGGENKYGAVSLLDARAGQVLARIEGRETNPDMGMCPVSIADSLDLDSDRLLEFVTVRPLATQAGRVSPPAVLEVWSGNTMLQLQGMLARSLEDPDLRPMHRFLFDACGYSGVGTWVPDCDGDQQPDLFVSLYPEPGVVGAAYIHTMLSLTRGVIWERRPGLTAEEQQLGLLRGIHQVLAVEDLDGDGHRELAFLLVGSSDIWVRFVSSGDGSILGEFSTGTDIAGIPAEVGTARLRLLHIPDLDGDGFGQVLLPRVQTLPDGQPQCTLMLYDLKRLR